MIDIAKLKAFVSERYTAPDSPQKKSNHLSLPATGGFSSFLGGMAKISGMSPLKQPDFFRVKERLKASEKQDDFITRLLYYINLKGKTHPQVYNAAGMTPDCFSKIISGKTKSPTRLNIIALAFALELNLEQTQDLLSRAGYFFPIPTAKEDIIFQYCLEDEDGPHTIDEVNEALVECGFNPIGGRI